MVRLAWFTPLPPDRSGIAAYSADILPRLAARFAIDVFTGGPGGGTSDGATGDSLRAGGDSPRVFSAHDFVWRHALTPYDLLVYQVGNATCHDYQWAYFPRYPGLVVLHDGQVHQARARQLLAGHRFDDYARELAYSHPEVPAGLSRLVESGLGGHLFYLWPMLRAVVASARLLGVHNRWLAESIAAAFPSAAVEVLGMGVGAPRPASRDAARARLGAGPKTIVFAAFGRVTPEKRLTPVLRALHQVRVHVPDVRLALIGEVAAYYDIEAEARSAGVQDLVSVTGYLDDAGADACLAAADVCLCLRWPSGRETSASWLRCLAAGRPTIVTDLAHTADVVALDPRGWGVLHGPQPAGGSGQRGRRPITVAIDILDEQHSLTLAMQRLALDGALREQLGHEAHLAWERGHTLAHMEEAYARAIARAVECPAPDRASLPAHLLADGTAAVRQIVAEMGVTPDFL